MEIKNEVSDEDIFNQKEQVIINNLLLTTCY